MKLYRITWKFMTGSLLIETQFRAQNREWARKNFVDFMMPENAEILLVEEVR
jgi:hypothetical protein